MKRSASILVGLGLILGLAAFAWAGGGWGYGGYGHMMNPGYHMGWAAGNGDGGYGPMPGPGRMMGLRGETASNQGWGPGNCPGWNGYYGDTEQAPPTGPQTDNDSGR